MKQKLTPLALAGLICVTAAASLPTVAGETGATANEAVSAATAAPAETAAARGNEMPDSDEYEGLSRKVLQYSEAFNEIVQKTKEPGFSEADWAPLEALVDTENFERMGVFLGPEAEVIGWQQYKNYISEYGGATDWEGTLRRITEVPGLVILELEERNTRDGNTDVSNTVTIYEFNDAGELTHLDVYVMPLP